ncbi:hypothetical protein OFR20_09150 [Brachyspira hyodysenteriae]|uniref:hypothetical protein n=1 Tax=Brachyspira hyodysenteriae TaxID=159 RepID=UPI0022CD689B|nr:hypothetical protein [Brachyspira hyodysenteriae]MCZ9981682.1 hypothetical protein [Brachyspira hyodysenteriae]
MSKIELGILNIEVLYLYTMSAKEYCSIFTIKEQLPMINYMYEIIYNKNYDIKSEYVDFIDNHFILNERYKEDKIVLSEFRLLNDLYNRYLKNETLLLKSSIIGKVDIVDVIVDSKSKWAYNDSFHWILDNPTLFDSSINNIKGNLGLWNYNL